MNGSLTTTRGRVQIRQGKASDARNFREIRLFALEESPTAFGADYQTSASHPIEHWGGKATPDENGTVYFAVHDEEFVGMAGINRRDLPKARHSAAVWGVFVRPEWRSLQIGKALIEACIAWAAPRAVSIVKLAVVTTNLPAVCCYERCGFRVYGTEPRAIFHDGQYYDEYLMARQIVPIQE